eukprot:Skav220887  [mRNA]  locus=scaffold1977:74653:75158:+ [translate_table: standard]
MTRVLSDAVLEDDVSGVKVTAPNGIDVIAGALDVGVINQGILHKTMKVDAISMKISRHQIPHGDIPRRGVGVCGLRYPNCQLTGTPGVVVQPHILNSNTAHRPAMARSQEFRKHRRRTKLHCLEDATCPFPGRQCSSPRCWSPSRIQGGTFSLVRW